MQSPERAQGRNRIPDLAAGQGAAKVKARKPGGIYAQLLASLPLDE